MTLAILQFPTSTPTARELMDRALDPHILIGMPQLNAYGLSETWLMKELGHRHWLMLACSMGMEDADFRASDGSAAYAAICATSLRNGRLDLVAANDVLTIRSSLSAVSRTQTSSHHRLFVGASEIAEVELLSTFVHRSTAGDNHSIARIGVSGHAARVMTESPLARSAAEMRAAVRAPSLECNIESLIGSSSFRTSPSQEFNGAGLFYFAQFQALMDKAYEEHLPIEHRRDASGREVFFFGNVRENEVVKVDTHLSSKGHSSLEYLVYREDGRVIAFARRSSR